MSDKKENPQLLPFHRSNERSFADNERADDGVEVQDDLRQLLQRLRLPESTDQLDRRILSSYASQIERRPFWKRLLKGTIPIPIPIAAIIVLSIASLVYLALRPSTIVVKEVPKPAFGEQIKIVEVPVVKEHLVTRTVYINQHSGSRRQTSIDNRNGGVDLGGFKPVEELKIRLLEGDEQHEK
jgi:hypothetical protein